MNRKNGEQEALSILRAQGFVFDESYGDDGTKHSNPDLRYSDGRYLEVTHTYHNNVIVSNPLSLSYNGKSLEDRQKVLEGAEIAFRRIKAGNYKTIEERNKDRHIIDNVFGSVDPRTVDRSEFECDLPVICASSDNVLRTIREKGNKYPNGNTDLFIFALKEEIDSVLYLIETKAFNGATRAFFEQIIECPFPAVYVSQWDFEHQLYDIEKPRMIVFYNENDTIRFEVKNQ